jgi:hypothetical protein
MNEHFSPRRLLALARGAALFPREEAHVFGTEPCRACAHALEQVLQESTALALSGRSACPPAHLLPYADEVALAHLDDCAPCRAALRSRWGGLSLPCLSAKIQLRPLAALASASWVVRAAALLDLARADATTPERPALRDRLLHDDDDDVRAVAALLLGRLQDRLALPGLRAMATERACLPQARALAFAALAKVGDMASAALARETARDRAEPPALRQAALGALLQLQVPCGFDPQHLLEEFAQEPELLEPLDSQAAPGDAWRTVAVVQSRARAEEREERLVVAPLLEVVVDRHDFLLRLRGYGVSEHAWQGLLLHRSDGRWQRYQLDGKGAAFLEPVEIHELRSFLRGERTVQLAFDPGWLEPLRGSGVTRGRS